MGKVERKNRWSTFSLFFSAQWIDGNFQTSGLPCFTSILRAGEDSMTKGSWITVHSRFLMFGFLPTQEYLKSFEKLPQSTISFFSSDLYTLHIYIYIFIYIYNFPQKKDGFLLHESL